MAVNWTIKHFSELTIDEFHDLIQLRTNVFVVEQNCPYPELDGKDKNAFHLIGHNSNQIIATARILPKGVSYANDVAIGRVVVDSKYRKNKFGDDLMIHCIHFITSKLQTTDIRISAQKHLEHFYNKHTFISTGKEYDEDGIPHVEMTYLNKN